MSIRKVVVVLSLVIASAVLQADSLKIEKYDVNPGNIFKHFGTQLDKDIEVDKDGKITRKGLLTDGILAYAPSVGICYVFWRVTDEESFVRFQLKLAGPSNIEKVVVYGENLSDIYAVTKAIVESANDEISAEKIGEFIVKDKVPQAWSLEIPCNNKEGQTLNVTVWTKGSSYLNVTEIQVYGKAK